MILYMEILNNYFQRYSEKENVITDNTMRLFSLLKDYNFSFYNKFLEKIRIVNEDESLNIKIVVQEKDSKQGSIPDAIITQIGYKIVVEVKLENNFDYKQLINHVTKLNDTVENKILLTIGKEKMIKELQEKVDKYCQSLNVKHINLTFSNIITNMYDIIENNENFQNKTLKSIIEDYRKFCDTNKILETSHTKMYAFTCNDTKDINLKYNLYYRPCKNYENFDYLGLYFDKKVGYIGKVENVVIVELKDNKPIIKDFDLEEEKRNRILSAISERNDLKDDESYYFYLVNEYVQTNFVKITPYPIWSRKVFDLKEILELNIDINKISLITIADELKNKTWE